MVEKATEKQIKLLMWLVAILLTFTTVVSLWSFAETRKTGQDLQAFKDKMPSEYVRTERYKSDCDKEAEQRKDFKDALMSVNNKLDRLLLHNGISPRVPHDGP